MKVPMIKWGDSSSDGSIWAAAVYTDKYGMAQVGLSSEDVGGDSANSGSARDLWGPPRPHSGWRPC
eukprot:3748249-Pyramimonas_sp.AAC.1